MSKFYASSKRPDWMTPEHVQRGVAEVRDIDLDPCAARNRDHWFATYNVTEGDSELPYAVRKPASGLLISWARCTDGGGCAFFNPPYGRTIGHWIRKAVEEAGRGCEVIGLVPAATGAGWFSEIWKTAAAVFFVEKRLKFVRPDGEPATSATFWSALPYWGGSSARFADRLGSWVEGHSAFLHR